MTGVQMDLALGIGWIDPDARVYFPYERNNSAYAFYGEAAA